MPLIIPTLERKLRLKSIHKELFDYRFGGNPGGIAHAVSHMLTDPEFQKTLAAGGSPKIQSEADLLQVAWKYLYMLLSARDYVAAAFMLWGPKTFTPEPHCAQLMWNGLFEHSLINVMGSASTGKTFAPSAWVLLDWVLDPEWTRVQVVSNSEDHVRKNLFGDIVRLHQEAVLDLPGKVDTESISLDKKRAMGIFVLVIPGGPTARGKLKGAKIKNRPEHPLFGDSSRLRVILDEAQEIPANIFDELPNLLASMDNSIEHIKILCAANPKDEWSRYGQNCKPGGGWDKITALQETWESETGWWVIRINAMLTENVMQRKTVFPRLITWEGVQKIIKSQGGGNDQHPTVYTFVYGMFPPSGLLATAIRSDWLRRAEKEWIFDTPATGFGANDVAYTGDFPTFSAARTGRAVGWYDYENVRHELPEPAWKIQVDGVAILQRGDTQDMADEDLSRAKHLGLKPEHFAIDKTGSPGVHDLVRRQWAQKVGPLPEEANGIAGIVGINYSESASDVKIADEDTETPKDLCDIVASELWYAAGKLFEYDCIGLGRGVDTKTFEELAARKGGLKPGKGKKWSVESKKDYKARTGENSPDRADATLMVIHVARINTPGLIPKAKDTEKVPSEQAGTPWDGFGLAFNGVSLAEFGHDVIETMKD